MMIDEMKWFFRIVFIVGAIVFVCAGMIGEAVISLLIATLLAPGK
jgi:hypothetical protein